MDSQLIHLFLTRLFSSFPSLSSSLKSHRSRIYKDDIVFRIVTFCNENV